MILKIRDENGQFVSVPSIKGFSPLINEKVNTDDEYILTIENEDGSYDTPNLKYSNKMVGELNSLLTENKGSVVDAINEIYQKLTKINIDETEKTIIFSNNKAE